MEKIKQIAKYTTNILAIIAALVAGINAVDGITIPYAIQIVQVIAVLQGIIRNISFRKQICLYKRR